MLWAELIIEKLYNVICFKIKAYLIIKLRNKKLHMDFTKQNISTWLL